MADGQSLSTIPHNDPLDGPGVMAPLVPYELDLAGSLLEMAQIPVVTQDSQEGELF